MKKILFVSGAAIIAAVGLSSFRTVKTTGPFYFETNAGVNKAAKSKPSLFPSQITYVASISAASCDNTSGFDCVVTFATSLLTAGDEHLAGSAAQQIRATVATRASR